MNENNQSVGISAKNSGISTMPPTSSDSTIFWETLSNSTELFHKSLKLGRVRGIVCIEDLPTTDNAAAYPHLIRELISRDILVTVADCKTVDMEKAGMTTPDLLQSADDGLAEFCDFIGIQPALPLGTASGAAIVTEFYATVARLAAVKLAELPAVSVATRHFQGQTQSHTTLVTMEDNPATTADRVDQLIHDKRIAAQWCDRCGGRFSPFS